MAPAWRFRLPGKRYDPHIYITNLSDANPIRLTSDVFPDFQPVFSTGGTRPAFFRRAGGPLRVVVTPSEGGVEHQVGEVMDFLYESALMTWDADGQNLVVSDRPGESRGIALFQFSVENGARRQITFPPDGASDSMHAVSPDGRTLGCARSLPTGRGDLWPIPLAGGPVRRLTTSNELIYCWSWTADGRDLLVGHRRSGRAHLWRQPAEGGPQVRVDGLDDQVMELSVARTGNRIATCRAIWKTTMSGDIQCHRQETRPNR